MKKIMIKRKNEINSFQTLSKYFSNKDGSEHHTKTGSYAYYNSTSSPALGVR